MLIIDYHGEEMIIVCIVTLEIELFVLNIGQYSYFITT